MNKLTSLLVFALPLAACEPTTTDIKECPGSNGKDVTIVLKLKAETNAVSGTNYQDLEIELIGKKQKDKWLNRKLKASDANSKKAVICVDGQALGEYEYDVVVPGVGKIDPRVDVKN